MKPTHRYFNAHPHEIAAALRGELRCVVRRGPFIYPGVSVELRNGAFCGKPEWWYTFGDFPAQKSMTGKTQWKCPLGQPGTRLLGREAWSVDNHPPSRFSPNAKTPDGGEVMYKATDGWDGPWQSASTMPEWAVRPECRFVVETAECKRASELTEEEARSGGFPVELRHDDPLHPMDTGKYFANPIKGSRLVMPNALHAMKLLHESKHGPGSWDTDFVWVAKAKREGGGE